MKKRCTENTNSDDELSTLTRDIKNAFKELERLRQSVSSKLYQSKLIDKKYALFRNRYILRTGEEPDMSILKELYTDVSFMKEAKPAEEVKPAEEEKPVEEVKEEEVKPVEEEVKEEEV